MILPIERWLENQKISLEASSCFHEAFTCYRASSYKAALLFSYLGFMNVIRDRILTSTCPMGFQQPQWASVQRDLQESGTWDKAAFDSTQRKNPAPIFVIPDDLRRQVIFWKDRRNNCAHSKDNKITASHVEAFLDFVESNMNKFAVNGSRSEMARRIHDHYDPSLTPPGSDVTPLVQEVSNAVLQDELPAFLTEVSASFDAARNSLEISLNTISSPKVDFLNAILQAGTPPLVEAAKDLLLSDERLLLGFLRSHPERITILDGNPERVRRIWHEFLFTDAANDFPVIAGMLRNNLIPREQLEECMRHLIQKGTASIPNDIDNLTLEQNGFYRVLEETLTDSNLLFDFEWANKARSLVVKHIADRPLSVELARKIYQSCNTGNHPWHLASHLTELFRTDQAKREEYLTISDAHEEIGQPRHIPTLTRNP